MGLWKTLEQLENGDVYIETFTTLANLLIDMLSSSSTFLT